jgi:hypothetical protein
MNGVVKMVAVSVATFLDLSSEMNFLSTQRQKK